MQALEREEQQNTLHREETARQSRTARPLQRFPAPANAERKEQNGNQCRAPGNPDVQPRFPDRRQKQKAKTQEKRKETRFPGELCPGIRETLHGERISAAKTECLKESGEDRDQRITGQMQRPKRHGCKRCQGKQRREQKLPPRYLIFLSAPGKQRDMSSPPSVYQRVEEKADE